VIDSARLSEPERSPLPARSEGVAGSTQGPPPQAAPDRRRGGRPVRALLLGFVVAAFLAAVAVPYRVDTDTGFQLKAVQQWLQGQSRSPGTLWLPDPRDLSQDVQLWSPWWPPGFPFAYTLLVATGLSLATALRLTSLLLFLAGGIGWLWLADDLAPRLPARLLFAAAIGGYAFTIGGAASLRSADILSFAAGPWLARLTLHAARRGLAPLQLWLAGLAGGATYLLKYSLFLTALPACGFLALLVWRRDPAGTSRFTRLAALGCGVALPVAALVLLNLRLSGNLTETVTGSRSEFQIDQPRTVRPGLLALSLAGAPGLGLFQNDLWIGHLAYFSDAHLPLLRGHDHADRLAFKSWLGLPVTLLMAWALRRAWRRRPSDLLALTITLTAAFYLEMLAVSVLVQYNYLAGESPRLAAGFLPLTSLFVLGECLDGCHATDTTRLHRLLAAIAILLVAVPLAFGAGVFLKHDLYARTSMGYRPTGTGLFTPELSVAGPGGVLAAVAAVRRSPRDLVVLAGPSGWGSAFVMWLETSSRTLPVSTFYAPLGAAFAGVSNLRATTSYTSSQPMRVILVVARSVAAEGWQRRLQSRFRQVRRWEEVAVPPGAAVVVSYGDLEPR
jgi:hypothetical protein